MASVAKQPGVWGIDLGQCAFKAIRLEKQDGEIVATAFDYVEHAKILGQPDADPDQLTREALEKFLSRNDLRGDTVAIGVAGQSGLARFVKLPPVDQRKITDIVKFEAKQQIPFPLHEVVWGYQRLGKGTTSDNMILDAEVGLFAMKRDMINRALQHFKEVGIEVHYIQMAPLALCNFLAHDLLGKGAPKEGGDDEEAGGKECVVGLDIGTDNSNLVITDGEKVIWQRPIPLGGNHFTRALTKDLKLTFAKAEHLKRNAVKSPDLKKILGALKPVLNDFVSEVQRSLGYFTNTHRDATIKHMLGLGNAFRLPGLQKYLQEKLQLEVRKLQKIQRLNGEDSVTEAPQYVENVLSFGVAQGLALQGLNESCIHVNLLPPEIAADRRIRAKKPWAVAAAAALLLLAPPLMLGWAAAKEAWENKGVSDANKQLESVVSTAKKQKAELEELESKGIDNRAKVQSLAGGVNDRFTWMHLYHFVSEILPRPDGTYLSEAARTGARPYAKFFKGDPEAHGEEAYEKWKNVKAKLARGEALSPQDQNDEEWIKKHLVQIHIESVSALYSENLVNEYFSLMKHSVAYAYSLKGHRKDEIKHTRDGGGFTMRKAWIVEVHGYTYHTDRDAFIENTIVENLTDISEPNLADRRLKNVKLHPETEKALREKDKARVGYIVLYDTKYDPNPWGGAYGLINKTVTAPNLQIFGGSRPVQAAAAPAAPAAGADPAAAPAAPPPPPGPQRNQWRPPFDTAIVDIFQASRGNVKGPDSGGPPLDRPGVVRAGRTEFIVLFLWQEKIGS